MKLTELMKKYKILFLSIFVGALTISFLMFPRCQRSTREEKRECLFEVKADGCDNAKVISTYGNNVIIEGCGQRWLFWCDRISLCNLGCFKRKVTKIKK